MAMAPRPLKLTTTTVQLPDAVGVTLEFCSAADVASILSQIDDQMIFLALEALANQRPTIKSTLPSQTHVMKDNFFTPSAPEIVEHVKTPLTSVLRNDRVLEYAEPQERNSMSSVLPRERTSSDTSGRSSSGEQKPEKIISARQQASIEHIKKSKTWLDVLSDKKQHPEWSRAHRFVTGPLDTIVACVIAANTIVTLISLQWEGYRSDVYFGLAEPGGWRGAEAAFFIMEHCFNAVFVLEMLFRVAVYRTRYFHRASNVLDFVIVLVTSCSLYLSALLHASSVNLNFARMIRLARLVRVLRFARVLKFVAPLRVLLFTIVSSFSALVWSMVMLMILQIVSAIFLCQALNGTLYDDSIDLSMRLWANRYYGSSPKAMWSLFELTFSGCWPTYVRPLVEGISSAYAIFFFVYVTLVIFGVMRIVSALFLQETMKASARDVEYLVQESMTDTSVFLSKISDLFVAADTNNNGSLCREEFAEILSDERVRAYLAAIDIEVLEVEGFFRLLDDGDGEISYEEFLGGIMRLKGTARSQDVVAILHTLKGFRKELIDALRPLRLAEVSVDAPATAGLLASENSCA